MNSNLLVSTTSDDRQLLEKIAKVLVEKRLVACAQISGPISSSYRWQGKVANDEEWLLTLKTTDLRWAELEAAIRQLHSYDVPEIIATPIVHISKPYQEWLEQQVASEQ